MALTGMQAFSLGGLEFGGDFISHTWTFELEPHDSFAQLTVADYWDSGDEMTLQLGITRLTHRKASGQDKVIHLTSVGENVDIWSLDKIAGDPKMSSITVGMGIMNIDATWLLQIFSFD